MPTRPTAARFFVGKHAGKILSLNLTGFESFTKAISFGKLEVSKPKSGC